MKYIVISDGAVDETIFVKAHQALAFARKELEMPMIEIKWFVRQWRAADYTEEQKIGSFENVNDAIGGTFRNNEPLTIYIDPTYYQLTKAVLHETYHSFQFNKCFGVADEATAHEYADNAFKRIFMNGVEDSVYYDHLSGKDWSVATAQNDEQKKQGDQLLQTATRFKRSGEKAIKKRAYGHIVVGGK